MTKQRRLWCSFGLAAWLALPHIAQAQTEAQWGICRSYCSQTEIGNTLIEVLLSRELVNTSTAQLPVSERSASQQLPQTPPIRKITDLEITTYVDGFTRGRFLTLSLTAIPAALRRSEGAFATSRSALMQRTDAATPGLQSIAVRSVAEDASDSPLNVSPSTTPRMLQSPLLITLDQAEPGRTYFVRPSGTARSPLVCQAVICPTDLVAPKPGREK